jgi:hypothetical protein
MQTTRRKGRPQRSRRKGSSRPGCRRLRSSPRAAAVCRSGVCSTRWDRPVFVYPRGQRPCYAYPHPAITMPPVTRKPDASPPASQVLVRRRLTRWTQAAELVCCSQRIHCTPEVWILVCLIGVFLWKNRCQEINWSYIVFVELVAWFSNERTFYVDGVYLYSSFVT